ncbi:MAG: excinuclease ABC subunit C, partial [Lachnospiraceae bacterium]|nr:excinuclease ABC subunit C [Lachnospiraceae bacterium]
QTSSRLEEIPGIGPARKKALMREFGSIAEIMEADVERLAQVPELTQSAAEEVYRYFHKEKKEQVNTTAGEPQTDGSSTP